MDKRQLCSTTVTPSWCCAVLAPADHAVSVPRGHLRAHLLGTPQWYLLFIPLSVTAFHGCRNLEARCDFSLSLPRAGQGSCGRKGLPPTGPAGGNGSADTSEKLYTGLNTSCQKIYQRVSSMNNASLPISLQ